MFISIVIPAYDEMVNLRFLLPSITEVLGQQTNGFKLEILVILPKEASESDIQEVKALGAKAIARQPSNYFGDAIRSGIANLSPQSDFTIFMDADGSHQPFALKTLIDADSKFHVVVASRYIKGGKSENSSLLQLMSRGLNIAYSIVLGIDCRDVSTNFKRFFSQDLVKIRLNGRDFDVVEELLFRVKMLHHPNFNILEVPDTFYERVGGKSKRKLGPFILSYLVSLFKLRIEYRRRRL